MAAERILLIDDDDLVLKYVGKVLALDEYETVEARTCAEALAVYHTRPPDLAICDYELPDGTALDLLPQLHSIDPLTRVIVLTGHGTVDLAVRAMKEGAEHFLTKPPDFPTLRLLVQRVLERRRLERRFTAIETRTSTFAPFIGTSAAITALSQLAARVAASESTILIRGETGCGKGVLARWLHENSPRRDEALVDVNCAGLSRDLLESEMFGHERGAFTGAVARKRGLLEVSHRGTLFLDEIGDMDLSVQGKLLKVIEERSFRRLGDVTDRAADVRLIAATHRNLRELVSQQRFREDLFFRINTVPLDVPALRDRPEDIPALAEHILVRLGAEMGRPRLQLSPAATEALKSYRWPGNIRELKNVLERATLLSVGDRLHPKDFRFEDPAPGTPDVPGESMRLEEVERRHIERVLKLVGGRVPAAAETLGIPRSTLYQRIKTLGIHPSEA